MSRGKTIALDFDGVIHQYTTPFTYPDIISDEPVSGAFDFIRHVQAAGYQIVIFSCRADERVNRVAMQEWLLKHGLEWESIRDIRITDLKPKAEIYIDDRGWRFDGTFPSLLTIERVKPWNHKQWAPK